MQIAEHLSLFSIEDLRTLAERRGFLVPEMAARGRQTLVKALSGALQRYENVYRAVGGLNRAEIEVLRQLLSSGRVPGLSAIAPALGAEPSAVRPVLDSLRLWGLAFPEGDWEHIQVPHQTRMAHHYLPAPSNGPALLSLAPPELQAAPVRCEARSGSLGWDLAEFLARVARTRLKLTQAGRLNRRDLKSMETGFAVGVAGYATFLSTLVWALGLLGRTDDHVLQVREEADAWLGQPEEARAGSVFPGWIQMRGYAESATGDPAEADYLPVMLPLQRQRILEVLRGLAPDTAYSVATLHERLVWSAPASFQQWDATRDPLLIASRMIRSLHWLGIVAVDYPERPMHFRLTPLGIRALRPELPELPALVPEDPCFFLQPNAEAFAPPNLAPRTLFHLRRITGEKKGGPLGVYPLSQDSLRRALDSGVTVSQLTGFLERYSRTGLPGNVKALVETAGRQHGRIRLVPTGYVVVTEDPQLLEELRRLKTVEPLLGSVITERVAAVETDAVTPLLRQLRQKGYAPLNEAETGYAPDLPEDPNTPPPPFTALPTGNRLLTIDGDWGDPDAEELLPEPSEPVHEADAIRELLGRAEECSYEVQIEYHAPGEAAPLPWTIWPLLIGATDVYGVSVAHKDERKFNLSRIVSARLTGETYPA